jgi:hypothetical protein
MNRLWHALRSFIRGQQAVLSMPGTMQTREAHTLEQWKVQRPARAALAEDAAVAVRWLDGCVRNDGVSLSGGTEQAPLRLETVAGGSCAVHPLLEEGSMKAPIRTLDGLAGADAAGDDEDEEEAALGNGEALPAANDEQEESDRALNRESAEYTMAEETVDELVRAEGAAVATAAPLRNIEAMKAADAARLAVEKLMQKLAALADKSPTQAREAALKPRSALTNEQCRELITALGIKEDAKVVKKLDKGGLVALLVRDCVGMCNTIVAWVEWANRMLGLSVV